MEGGGPQPLPRLANEAVALAPASHKVLVELEYLTLRLKSTRTNHATMAPPFPRKVLVR